ncbi:DNA cytosine methyltransferase [Chromobacterium vaccinii]|uniref:DNA cytosine methyltransferase n=1 Tax=Chromobacterium vaccinii TaxID=1108595 RepID=UPI001E3A3E48|nr:DNA cytosine methyltransferase [Chromobacterium vaccinii]MCD4483407.1 DNA cytosine methyltransferase [Chromobacterium vaccinii]
MNELALFGGAGGGILGGHLLGWRTVCAVERDAYAAQVLAQRQTDGCLAPFPIWSDVCSFDGRPWAGFVDVVSGGFPCQDISAAGRGAGIEGERSGLWAEMARIIGEVQPRFVLLENSPLLVGRGLALVVGDLAEMGFDAEWTCLSASDLGAPHKRDRIWLAAVANRGRGRRDRASGGQVEQPGGAEAERTSEAVANADSSWELQPPIPREEVWDGIGDGGTVPESSKLVPWCAEWPAEPGVGRVVDGLAHRVDRIKALGNGQVPRVAAAAWTCLKPNAELS